MQAVSLIDVSASLIHGSLKRRPKRSFGARGGSGHRMSEDLTHFSYYHIANFTGGTTIAKKRHALSAAEQGELVFSYVFDVVAGGS